MQSSSPLRGLLDSTINCFNPTSQPTNTANKPVFDGRVGCSELYVKAGVTGRTLDYPFGVRSDLVKIPRGQELSSKAPNGNTGREWTSQYGILGLTAFGDENNDRNIIDGINEAGLKMAALTLEVTEYQDVPAGQESNAMALSDLFVWILGTCATVDEVKSALAQTYVWGDQIPPLPTIPPLHFTVRDRNGDGIVIEYINKELKIHNNVLGAVTNDPAYDKQVANYQRSCSQLNTGFEAGQYPGTGLLGLRGDFTTTSRFERAATLVKYAKVGKNPMATARQLIAQVEVPKGLKLAFPNNQKDYDCTRWKTVIDHTNLIFSYALSKNQEWYTHRLSDYDFSPNSEVQSWPICAPKKKKNADEVQRIAQQMEEVKHQVRAKTENSCVIS